MSDIREPAQTTTRKKGSQAFRIIEVKFFLKPWSIETMSLLWMRSMFSGFCIKFLKSWRSLSLKKLKSSKCWVMKSWRESPASKRSSLMEKIVNFTIWSSRINIFQRPKTLRSRNTSLWLQSTSGNTALRSTNNLLESHLSWQMWSKTISKRKFQLSQATRI